MLQKLKKIFKHKKINLIDICILFLLIISAAYAINRFSRIKKTIFIDLTTTPQDWLETPMPPPFWFTDNLQSGNISYSQNGQLIGEITQISKSYWGANRQSINLTIKAAALYNSASKTFMLNGQPVLIGSPLELVANKTKFSGVVTDFYQTQEEKNRRWKKASAEVTIKYRNLDPAIAEALKQYTIKDSQNNIIATTKKIVVEPADIIISTATGNILQKKHPINKDVTLTILLENVTCTQNDCYYDNTYPLKIGSPLWLKNGQIILSPPEINNSGLKSSIITSVNIHYD